MIDKLDLGYTRNDEAKEIDSSPNKIQDVREGLCEVLKSEGKDRSQALKEYKDYLLKNQEAIMALQEELIETILNDPDISYERGTDIIRKYTEDNGLEGWQGDIILDKFNEYRTRHARVELLRNKYKDDDELYEYLFGQKPVGKIEIITLPIAFYIRFFNEQDYIFVYCGVYKGHSVHKTDIDRAHQTGGAAIISYKRIPGLAGSVLIENSTNLGTDLSGENSDDVRRHEFRHALNYFFQPKNLDNKAKSFKMFAEINEQEDDNKKKMAIVRWLRSRRNEVEEEIKDEVIAYLSGNIIRPPFNPVISGDMDILEGSSNFYRKTDPEKKDLYKRWVFRTLTEKGGLYDYIQPVMEDCFHSTGWLVNDYKYRRAVIKQVFITEYEEIIKEGIDSFSRLIERGFSTEKIASYLLQYPLHSWPKITNRLITGKLMRGDL